MKSEIEKMKPIVSLFLEGLMLVFIFVYSQNNIAPSAHHTDDSPLRGILSFHEVVFLSGWSSESINKQLPQQPTILTNIFPPVTTDETNITLAMSDALSVN